MEASRQPQYTPPHFPLVFISGCCEQCISSQALVLVYWLWSAWSTWDLRPTAPELVYWCDACFDYIRTVWFAGCTTLRAQPPL